MGWTKPSDTSPAIGHRHITYIDGGRGTVPAVRRRAYQSAMRHHRLAEHINIIQGGETEYAGAERRHSTSCKNRTGRPLSSPSTTAAPWASSTSWSAPASTSPGTVSRRVRRQPSRPTRPHQPHHREPEHQRTHRARHHRPYRPTRQRSNRPRRRRGPTATRRPRYNRAAAALTVSRLGMLRTRTAPAAPLNRRRRAQLSVRTQEQPQRILHRERVRSRRPGRRRGKLDVCGLRTAELGDRAHKSSVRPAPECNARPVPLEGYRAPPPLRLLALEQLGSPFDPARLSPEPVASSGSPAPWSSVRSPTAGPRHRVPAA